MTGPDVAAAQARLAADLAGFDRAFPARTIGGAGFLVRQAAGSAGGRAVVLLPGSSGTSAFFHRVLPLLPAGRAAPVLVDYPGPPGPETLAAELGRVLDALGLSDPVVVGCSYSAYWLQHLPRVAPGRAGHLILCNGFVEAADLLPSPLFDPDHIRRTPATDLRGEWAERARANAGTALGDLSFWSMTRGLAAEDLKGRLISVATARPIPRGAEPWPDLTIVDCDDDPIVRHEARARFRATHPQARKLTLTGGHFPYVTEPAGFAAMLRDHI